MNRDPDLWATAIGLILIADRGGIIDLDYPEIAQQLNRPIEFVITKMAELSAPHPESKCQDWEGRFIIQLSVQPASWKIVTFTKCQDTRASEHRKGYRKIWMRKWRAKQREQREPKREHREQKHEQRELAEACTAREQSVNKREPTPPSKREQVVNTREQNVNHEGEGEGESTRVSCFGFPKHSSKKGIGTVSPEWLAQLQADPTYSWIDIQRQFGKLVNWCKVHKKIPSQRRVIDWLNRIEPTPDQSVFEKPSRSFMPVSEKELAALQAIALRNGKH